MKVMRALVVLFVVSFLSPYVLQGQQAHRFTRPPITAKPTPRLSGLANDSCYHQVVSNEHVHVYRVQVAPHQSTLLDRHEYDYLVVSLGTNHMAVEGAASQFRLDLQDGEMQVVQGGWTHRVTNTSDMPLRFVEVDVHPRIDPKHAVCGLAATPCSDGRFGKDDRGSYSYSTLFETDTVRLRKVELEGGVTLRYSGVAHDSLIVSLAEAELGSGAGAEPIKSNHVAAGDALWYPGESVSAITNAGKSAARFLVFEIK